MKSFSHPKSFPLIILGLILVFGCKKVDSPGNNPPNNQPPAITPVGTPVGDSVTKTIDANGGSINSDDGRMQLTIPAGALSASTDISIQSVTDETPGGIGLSYHLMPDGTTFSKPVTLTFHYTKEDVNGTHPYLLYIAYQDKTLAWKADFKKRNVDTVAKTVSLDISHFSIWTMGDRIVLNAYPYVVSEGETSALSVVISDPGDNAGSGVGVGGDDLPSLPVATPLPNDAVSNWKVNGVAGGNSNDGTVSGSGSIATYTAPHPINDERTVQVSAELNYQITYWNNGRAVSSVNRLILFKDITLQASNFEYHLHVEFDRTFYSTTVNTEYSDIADMDITIHGNDITISPATNRAASIIPASTQEGLCTNTYLAGPNGRINITNAIGFVGTYVGDDPNYKNKKVFDIQLAEDGCYDIGWDFSCPPNSGGLSTHIDPKALNSFSEEISFILQKSDSTITYNPNDQEKTVYKLTHTN